MKNGYQSRIRASSIRLARWNAAWVASCALMAFGPKVFWNKDVLFTLLAVALNVAVGVGLILASVKYVEELDELQRKVYLNALGITVGVALIAGIPYSVMDTYDVIPFEANIAHLVGLMGLTFFLSFRYGTWRYR
jgi:hypothetical protein